MSKITNIIIWMIIGMLIGFILIGGMVRQTSDSMCEKECMDMNALTYEIISSGNWFKADGICICIFKDKIKAFELGD